MGFFRKKTTKQAEKQKKSQLRDWTEALIVAAILALIIRTFLVQAFKIPSGSMEDTLLIGDHLLVNKFIYGTQLPFSDEPLLAIRQPERGDIIVFEFPEDKNKSYFKRRDFIYWKNRRWTMRRLLCWVPQGRHSPLSVMHRTGIP